MSEELLSLSQEERDKVLTGYYLDGFLKSTKGWASQGIDLLEALGINDYESGQSVMELPLGVLTSAAAVLRQCFVEQNRLELQVFSEQTEYAANLSTQIYDYVEHLNKVVYELIDLSACYHAALQHRKNSNRHLISDAGKTIPFTEQELKKQEEGKEESKRAWDEQLGKQRQKLEDSYWGRAEPPALEDGYSSAQLPLPMWSVGFTPEQEGN